MKKYFILILLVLAAFLNLKANNNSPIFILNSFHPEFKWTVYQVTGIRNALQHSNYTGNLYVEYLDTKNFNYSEMEPMYYDLFKRKYRGYKFKVVLCTDNDALRFLKKYGNELFPKASFVFCGMNDISDTAIIDREKFTGVVPDLEFDENIELILKILPETKEIVSFFDGTDFGKLIFSEYKASIDKFKNKDVKFTNIINPTLDELVSKLSQLKKGQVIFQGELGKDKNGIVNNPSNITAIIKKIAKVPLFGSEIDMLRKGVIGGKFVNPYFQSRIAGFFAMQILNGKQPKDIKIIKNFSAHLFYDYKELKRNGINQSLLPKTAVIINEPISYWKRNEELLIKVGLGFLVLLILIFILSFNIIARKKAENQLLKSKGEIDKILASITDCVWSVDFDKENKVKSFYFSPVI
ncbi:MAG: ABC transporter substrate binding protein, partial [bacterium]